MPIAKKRKAQPSFSAKFAVYKPKKRSLPPAKPKNLDRRSREYLTPAEVKRIATTAKQLGRNGFRDFLLITFAYRHALRVGELIEFRWDQVHFNTAKLHVNRLKNGDPSVHFLEGDELRWLRQLKREFPDSDFLFCSERGGPISDRQVRTIVARAAQEAGFKFSVHPHMLRHGKGFALAARGEDTRAIQGYLGHKNIQHTVLYTKLDPRRYRGFGRD